MKADDSFVGLDGYPCSFPEFPMGAALIRAIAALPGADALGQKEIEQKALFIWKQAEWARQEALNRNIPASQIASDKELRKLHDLCSKLADHLDDMHAPALTALADQGFLAIPMAKNLREIMDIAKYAFGNCEGQEGRGRKPEVEASLVSEIAGFAYKHVTGKRPTITTCPYSGKVSGVWPDFLQSVFDALAIRASVANQARVISELMRS